MGANKYRKGIRNSSANSVNQAKLAEEFQMIKSDARWGRRGGVGQATAWQCMGRVGYGICLFTIYNRVFSICLVGVGWEWGRGRIG